MIKEMQGPFFFEHKEYPSVQAFLLMRINVRMVSISPKGLPMDQIRSQESCILNLFF